MRTTSQEIPTPVNIIENTSNEGMPAFENNKDLWLKDFFIDELKDMYWQRNDLVKAVLKTKQASTFHELQHAYNLHIESIKYHLNRLEEAFELADSRINEKLENNS